MTPLVKSSLAAALAVAVFLGFRHASRALEADRPSDMPADAQFLTSGYDIAHNQTQGDWVVCRLDARQGTDWCRLTDQNGQVVYQGAYLPVGSPVALRPDQLRIAPANPDNLWVSSPENRLPIPVLPLAGGTVLVPAEDEYALEQRWKTDPTEYLRLLQPGQ